MGTRVEQSGKFVPRASGTGRRHLEDMADSLYRQPSAAEDLQVIIPRRNRTLLLQGEFRITLRICQRHRGPQAPMLMNVRAWQMSNIMLTAMIRDASERSCASSYYSRVRRPAASGNRERQQSLINFRFGAPAPRSGLDRSSAGAYKGVVPPGGAGWICGPVTTWGWPGASVRPVYPPLEYLGDHDCGQADPAGTCQRQAPVAGNQAVSGLPAMKGEAADVNRRQQAAGPPSVR